MVTVPGPELVVLLQRQVFCPLLTSHVTSQSLDLSDRCPCAVRGTPQASSTSTATTSSPSASSSTPIWCSTQSKGSPAWSRLRSARSTVTVALQIFFSSLIGFHLSGSFLSMSLNSTHSSLVSNSGEEESVIAV